MLKYSLTFILIFGTHFTGATPGFSGHVPQELYGASQGVQSYFDALGKSQAALSVAAGVLAGLGVYAAIGTFQIVCKSQDRKYASISAIWSAVFLYGGYTAFQAYRQSL